MFLLNMKRFNMLIIKNTIFILLSTLSETRNMLIKKN